MGSTENLIGMIFASRYEVLEILGRGGMGEVYKCRDQKTGEFNAIKVLHSHLLLDPQALRRFQQEAEAASRILHPNAINIIDFGTMPDGQPFIISEFVDGVSLAEHLTNVGRLRIFEATAIFVQICDALTEAHRYGVVHRDIKPSNIMLKKKPGGYAVKVVDFGIAKMLPREGDGTFVETSTGKLIGSPPYMSPEQCLGERIDFRSDIYSTGCVIYESLMGAPPFIGNNPMDTMYRQIHNAPAPLSGLSEDIRLVQRMNRIINRALEKAPGNRYQSAAALQGDLNSLTASSSRGMPPVAFFQLQLEGFFRKIVSAIGSSKIIIIWITMATIVIIAVSSCFLVPLVANHGPTAAQKVIDWQALPPPSTFSEDFSHAVTRKREELIQAIAKLVKTQNEVNPDSIFLHEKLASSFFDDEYYAPAAIYYRATLDLSEKLFVRTYSNYQATPATVHTIAKASERYAQCQLRFKRYHDAYKWAQSGLKWAFSDSNLDQEYKAYFCQIQGVALAKLGGSETAVNENCDNFIAYVNRIGMKANSVRKTALALSDIADCYLESGKWERALKVLHMTRDAYSLVESEESLLVSRASAQDLKVSAFALHAGLFNEAVADLKMAISLQHVGKREEVLKQFERSAEEFQSINGKNDVNRARVLFREADYLWSERQFVKSWIVRIEAMKIWVPQARSTSAEGLKSSPIPMENQQRNKLP